ncbi:unnamed protein product, partial [marine sediment metagenome]
RPEFALHPIKCSMGIEELEEVFWLSLFEFLRDILAKNRGLLWGHRHVSGGEQMADE